MKVWPNVSGSHSSQPLKALTESIALIQATTAVIYVTTFGSIPASSIPMMKPSQADIWPCLARRLRAILNVMVLPSVSWVASIASNNRRVSSSSPHILEVLTTLLKIRSGGGSALNS